MDAEQARLAALHAYNVLDTPSDPTLDRITALAAELLDAPAAAISLIDADRQRFKSRFGELPDETPRSLAFCNHTLRVTTGETLLVEDASLEPAFRDNPLVSAHGGVRFYLGAPLVDRCGHALGALCVIDTKPRHDILARDRRRLQVLAGLVMDELELRRSAQQVLEARRLLELAESLAGVGHWRVYPDGRVTWSDEVYRIHGLDRAGFDPQLHTGVAFYHPDDQARVAAAVERAFSHGEDFHFELRLHRADGVLRRVASRAMCQRNDAGEVCAVFGVFQDVTEQHALLEQMDAERERYRLLAENANDMISTTALDSTVLFVTPGVERVLGYSPEEIVGRRTLELTHPEDRPRVTALFRDLLRAGPDAPPAPYQFRGRRKNGSWAWLEGQPRVQRDADGAPLVFQDVVRDITARKRLELELEESKIAAEAASRAKSEFLANMSHELRTPLNSIIGFTHVLVRDGTLGPEHRHQLMRIEEAGRGLLTVVNDVLDFSRIEQEGVKLSPRPFSPVRLMENLIALTHPQATDKGLSLVVDYPHDRQVLATGDVDRLRQVLMNLLANAVKFTSRGEVRLALQTRLRDGCVGLTFQVSDTGIGISADQIDTLFQRFAQADGSISRRFGGTGLGLAISKRLLEAMGGSIEVWSEPGHGSTFEVKLSLPTAEALCDGEPPLTVSRPGEASCDEPRAAVRVLVAEDVPVNQELVRLMLAPLGCEVTVVGDGEQAVDALGVQAFDLILMDMQMPVLDGLEATRMIRRLGGEAARTPIVALTANVLPEQIERCRKAGMDDHVAKPFVSEDLQSAVLKWAHRRQAAAKALTPNTVLDDLVAQIGAGPIRGLLASLDAQMVHILATAPEGPGADLSRLAHSLRGAAGALGYGDAARACQAVEAAHRAGGSTHEPFAALQAACTAARAAVEERLAA